MTEIEKDYVLQIREYVTSFDKVTYVERKMRDIETMVWYLDSQYLVMTFSLEE